MDYKFKTDFKNEMNRIRDIVNRAISNYIKNVDAPKDLADASFHLIKSGGKRIRPIILLKVIEMFGGDPNDGIPASIAIEFLHNFTLIHDDIMDKDEFRRGVKTTHILYGESMALLAGDFLFSIVFNILSEKYDKDKLKMLVEIMSNASLEICKGQAMDINPDKYINSINDYMKMINLKTASLIEASAVSGTIIAGKYNYIGSIKDFGRKIGLAFQIADDLLGILGDPKKTGKPVGNDIRNGKRTLPILYTLERLDKSNRMEFLNIFGREDAADKEISRAVELIKSTGAIEYSRNYMLKLAKNAIEILNKFEGSYAKDFLEDLVYFIVYREM